MTTPKTRLSDLILRIQDEFFETDAPLTTRELQRRVKTDEITCRAVLGALTDAGVLMRIDDLYMRTVGPASPRNPPSRPLAA